MADVTKMNKSNCVSVSTIEVNPLQPGVDPNFLTSSCNIGVTSFKLQFKTTIKTKLSTVNHYLTNCNTKNRLLKERIIMQYNYTKLTSLVRPNFCKFPSSIKKWRRLTQFSIANLLCMYNYLLKMWVNCWCFCLFNFFNGFMFFSHHPMQIFLVT